LIAPGSIWELYHKKGYKVKKIAEELEIPVERAMTSMNKYFQDLHKRSWILDALEGIEYTMQDVLDFDKRVKETDDKHRELRGLSKN
jgi:hypothetical protein